MSEQALIRLAIGALKQARDALHFHYVEWDGEPEDAFPLQLARSECDQAIAVLSEECPNAHPNATDYRNRGERDAAYWRELCERLVQSDYKILRPAVLEARAELDRFYAEDGQ